MLGCYGIKGRYTVTEGDVFGKVCIMQIFQGTHLHPQNRLMRASLMFINITVFYTGNLFADIGG